jgi:hypothetical protein
LNSEDPTNRLENLLAEEETIAECKSQNPRLIEFLTKKENLSKLIRLATRIPEDPSNKNAAYK